MKNNRAGHQKGNSTECFLDKEVILKKLNISPGQIIIDVGCGNGYMSKAFARLLNDTGKVYAVDISHEKIEMLKTETRETNIIPIQADITNKERIGIDSASVDLIYLATVFHIFSKEQIANFQNEAIRLLRLGGKLAIVNIDKKSTSFGPPQSMRVSNEELNKLIRLKPISSIQLGEYFYMQIFENTE
jgi:ubiquinone/menaquinone biosynthesis C-methylase UbiE